MSLLIRNLTIDNNSCKSFVETIKIVCFPCQTFDHDLFDINGRIKFSVETRARDLSGQFMQVLSLDE